MEPPYLIAEIGVNYYDTASELGISPLDAAKMYIDEAAKVGIDAAKFQSYKAETLASINSPAYWDMSMEPTRSQYELFKKFDSFGEREYRELAHYCNERGIDFMSTPFDFESADYLEDLVNIYKISSSDITNLPFLRHIAQKGKPVYLSTGASYLSEVDEALRTLLKAGCDEVCLLHCILSYPTTIQDANLNMIEGLKNAFPNVRVGYSDHTVPDDSMAVLLAAFCKGAEVIEKHFTLNKELPGNDHYHAGDPSDFQKAINAFRIICKSGGTTSRTVLPCEEMSRMQARRSIVLAEDLPKGAILSESNLAFKRPGTGISPAYVNFVLGRELQQDCSKDTALTWKMI